MRALASNGFHSGSSSSKQCISSRLVHFKGTMCDDITSAVHCSNIMPHGVYVYVLKVYYVTTDINIRHTPVERSCKLIVSRE